MKESTAKIRLSPIHLQTIIGILPQERTTPQSLILHLALYVDSCQAALTDDITHAVDYAQVLASVRTYVEDTQFHLIETLAEKIAALILQDKRIKKIKLKLDKPQAFNEAPMVSIEIKRP
ncbi:MAG: dihydroneopterin aldolase [Candidatus Margulisbacteria bacterium]|nr:dihydroneopterin aldolase [Candidatus Margulisiibacteriota bacterium]